MSYFLPLSKKILILEDQRIVGFDLERQLKKSGYSVSYERSYDEVVKAMLTGITEIIISGTRELKKGMNGMEYADHEFISGRSGTSTLVIGQDENHCRSFEKPYNTEEIISFIDELTKK